MQPAFVGRTRLPWIPLPVSGWGSECPLWDDLQALAALQGVT